MGNNYLQSLEDLRTLSAPRKRSNSISGMSDLKKVYSNESSTDEEAMLMALEHKAISDEIGILTAQNLKTVEVIGRVVQRRNDYVMKQKAMGVEGFQDARPVSALALSTEGKAKDFFLKILRAIAEGFRRLIVTVSNIVKTVVTWVQSKKVKAQANTYETYRSFPKKADWEKMEITAYDYSGANLSGSAYSRTQDVIKLVSAQNGGAEKVKTLIEKYTEAALTDSEMRGGRVEVSLRDRGNYLKTEPTWKDGIKKATQKFTSSDRYNDVRNNLFSEVEKVVNDLVANFNIKKGKDGKTSAALWSGSALFNLRVFGTDKPTKKKQKAGDLMKDITGAVNGFDMLGTRETAKILSVVASGKRMIETLTRDVKFVEGIARKAAKVSESDRERFTNVSKSLNKMRTYKSVLAGNLLSSFMNYTRMRTYVYNIFVKAVRGADNFKENNSKKSAMRTVGKGYADLARGSGIYR